jgi:hypothetical protein
MHTTESISRTASGPPTLRDQLADVLPLLDTVVVAGPPVVVAWVGTVLFALMLAGPFALVATLVVVLVAAAAVVALAGAILATPYLLIRHLATRRHVSEGRAPIATLVARTAMAARRPGIPALAESTTARASR